jgi:predicted membrane protein
MVYIPPLLSPRPLRALTLCLCVLLCSIMFWRVRMNGGIANACLLEAFKITRMVSKQFAQGGLYIDDIPLLWC